MQAGPSLRPRGIPPIFGADLSRRWRGRPEFFAVSLRHETSALVAGLIEIGLDHFHGRRPAPQFAGLAEQLRRPEAKGACCGGLRALNWHFGDHGRIFRLEGVFAVVKGAHGRSHAQTSFPLGPGYGAARDAPWQPRPCGGWQGPGAALAKSGWSWAYGRTSATPCRIPARAAPCLPRFRMAAPKEGSNEARRRFSTKAPSRATCPYFKDDATANNAEKAPGDRGQGRLNNRLSEFS